MREPNFPAIVIIAAGLLAGASATAADKPAASDNAKLIASAVSAAPARIGKGATVVTMGEDGKMTTIRQGTNGWTCMPDSPGTPGPDPMCVDRNSMAWVEAWVTHKDPPSGKTGLMYMLAGGTDASNTDPYAQAPAAGNHWIKTGPHIMIVGGDASFLASYPQAADPDTSVPYVMWAGTPYVHLMAPVK